MLKLKIGSLVKKPKGGVTTRTIMIIFLENKVLLTRWFAKRFRNKRNNAVNC